jgi:hypothetical protein
MVPGRISRRMSSRLGRPVQTSGRATPAPLAAPGSLVSVVGGRLEQARRCRIGRCRMEHSRDGTRDRLANPGAL